MEKVALITGACGGLGQAMAAQLAAGHRLVLVSRDAARLQQMYGDDHVQIEADCTTLAGADAVLQQLESLGLPAPTLLAHCVGNIRLGAMHRMSEADFMACMQANLFSAYFMLAAFLKALRVAKQPGAAVLVSSAAARIGTPNHEAIAAAKGGLEAMVRGAAATYAPYQIRINAVAPGLMETPAASALLASEAGRELAARQYPLPGIGQPQELASLMVWLLSEQAARVTGQVWSLDGGYAAIRPLVK